MVGNTNILLRTVCGARNWGTYPDTCPPVSRSTSVPIPTQGASASALQAPTLSVSLVRRGMGTVVTVTGVGFARFTTATVWLDADSDGIRDSGEADLQRLSLLASTAPSQPPSWLLARLSGPWVSILLTPLMDMLMSPPSLQYLWSSRRTLDRID